MGIALQRWSQPRCTYTIIKQIYLSVENQLFAKIFPLY